MKLQYPNLSRITNARAVWNFWRKHMREGKRLKWMLDPDYEPVYREMHIALCKSLGKEEPEVNETETPQ